jgi:hypothetical protein
LVGAGDGIETEARIPLLGGFESFNRLFDFALPSQGFALFQVLSDRYNDNDLAKILYDRD